MSDPGSFFSVWRTITLAGSREVTEGQVAPEHVGPSAPLAKWLRAWPGAWYWADPERRRLVLVRGAAPARPERWVWHAGLFLLAVVTTLAAGAVLNFAWTPAPTPGLGGIVSGLADFWGFLVGSGWQPLLAGWSFAGPLLTILLVHELGHYLTARRYAIDVSPPYFLPVPPHLSPIGNLGAFIRIRTPVYDRRQLLDVGAAGPLAGFLVAVAVLWWGYHSSTRLPHGVIAPSMVALAGQPIVIGDSLLTRTLRDWILPGSGPVLLSPQAFAGWVGLFVTSLNLLPLSQLDGGHVLYGLLGRRQATVSLLAVGVLVWLGRQAPVWWIWAALSFAIGRGSWSHPAVVVPGRPVLRQGALVGLACLLVFALTFIPVPFAG